MTDETISGPAPHTTEAAGAFGAESTTDEVLAGIDLTGRRVLVTGVSAGLGVETARALVAHGADVVGAARDLDKAELATQAVRKAADGGRGSLQLVQLDLASLESVRACADALNADGRLFDVVIANAGVMATPFGRTADGFETQFGTNHLGHFVLVNRIAGLVRAGSGMGRLRAGEGFFVPARSGRRRDAEPSWQGRDDDRRGKDPADRPAAIPEPALGPGGRFVSLASAGHRFADVDLDDPGFERTPYDPWVAYGRAKTANVLFAVEFDRRHRERGVRAAAVHPGGIQTELGRHMTEADLKALVASIEASNAANAAAGLPEFKFKTIPQGAATSVWAAVVADADAVGGHYCEDCHVAEIVDGAGLRGGVRPYAVNPERAKALWAKSEAMVGESF